MHQVERHSVPILVVFLLSCGLAFVGSVLSATAQESGGEQTRKLSPQTLAKLAEMEKDVLEDPEDMIALARYGNALVQVGRSEEGLRRIARAIIHAPDEPAVLLYQAKAFWTAERPDDALEKARRVTKSPLATAKQKSSAAYLMGTALWKRGDLAEAEKAFRLCLEADRKNARARMNLGMMFFQETRFAEAYTELERAALLAPDDVKVHKTIGDIMSSQGRYGRAAKAYEEVARLRPDNVDNRVRLAGIYIELHEFEACLPHLREAVRIDDQDATAHLLLAECLVETGELDEAEKTAHRAAELGGRANTILALIEHKRTQR